MNELEAFELDAIRRTWDALNTDEQAKLRCLLEHTCWMIEFVQVEDPKGSISILGDFERTMFGTIKRDQFGHGIQKVTKRIRHDHPITADWQRLIDLGLVSVGRETTMNWGMNGGPPAYHLANFGQQVARYGNAATIVAEAELARHKASA